jgi:hypothetical protein
MMDILGLPDRFRGILSKLSYKDWEFHLGILDTAHFYLQMRFFENEQQHHGRKWLLSQWMSDSEIVQTALLAILVCEEHEAREKFKYLGQSVFGPHCNVDDLARYPPRLDVRGEPKVTLADCTCLKDKGALCPYHNQGQR